MEKPKTNNANTITIDFVSILRIIKTNLKKSLIIVTATAFVSIPIIFSIPRYYTANVKLTPEYKNKQGAGGLSGAFGNAAALFGVNLNENTFSDAIIPTFYPDIIATTDFLVPLMEVEVKTIEEDFKGTYLEYITTIQKVPWWNKIISGVFSLLSKNEETTEIENKKIDPFILTKYEKKLIDAISSSISCKVDSKTFAIEIATTAQDPLVAAIMANVVKEKLQEFITAYRTEKVKQDSEYSEKFFNTAHNDYIIAQKAYAEFVDKHQGVSRQIYKIEQERLLAEMQIAYNMYNAACQQKIVAARKLQEETPVFTEIQKASVPLLPSSPGRLSTTIKLMLLSFILFNAICVIANNKRKEENNV